MDLAYNCWNWRYLELQNMLEDLYAAITLSFVQSVLFGNVSSIQHAIKIEYNSTKNNQAKVSEIFGISKLGICRWEKNQFWFESKPSKMMNERNYRCRQSLKDIRSCQLYQWQILKRSHRANNPLHSTWLWKRYSKVWLFNKTPSYFVFGWIRQLRISSLITMTNRWQMNFSNINEERIQLWSKTSYPECRD